MNEKSLDENEQKTPAAAGEGATEAGKLREVDSPAIAPQTAGASAETSTETARQAGEPGQSVDADAPARDIIPFIAAPRAETTGAAAPAPAPRRFSKFTLLAASMVAAAAFGAMAGVLGATSIARLASDPAPAAAPDPTVALQSALAQLRSDVAALKTGVDATSRSSTSQYNKLVERFDRVERTQSAAAKADALKSDATLQKDASAAPAAAKDVTGSITPANPAAAALPVAPLPPGAAVPGAIVPGWAVRDVYRGVAMLQSRVGGMVEVGPGDVLPGLGRIEAIRRQDGRWVVITSRGMIVSMR